MAEFVFPSEWGDAPPPPSPDVDPDRIEGLQNGFLAATQQALHTAPDAFYRTTGQAAVEGAPALQQRLSQLRDDALAQAKDDNERAALAPRLDANLTYIQGGIDRHVAEQTLVRNQQIALERQALNLRLAELEHGDDSILPSVAEANASVAQHLARLRGEPEEPAMLAARSAVWRNAIDQRLATGQGPQALDLFERVQDQLVPADRRALEVPIQTALSEATADQWIAREADRRGEPLAARVKADTELSPTEKAIVLAKVEAEDSARDATRIATVKGLDDQLEATARSIATAPGGYRPGTLAALANAYEDTGEPVVAGPLRRLAGQESFLLAFSKSGAAAQQRLIESLPEGDERAAAESILEQQAEAFAQDAFSAGTSLYPDVGPPKPIEDMVGRIAQARAIAAYRGIPVVPFTADELAQTRRQLATGTPQEQQAVRVLIDSLPEDMKPALGGSSLSEPASDSAGLTPAVLQSTQGPLAKDLLTLVQGVQENKQQGDAARNEEIKRIKQLDRNAKIATEVRIFAPSFPDVYMVADIIVRGSGVAHLEIVEVKTGEARLSKRQVTLLAEALNTGDVYISNEEKAETLEIRPNETFKAQNKQPLVSVIGGARGTIMRQLMNEGIDISGGRSRLRLRLGIPPN